MKIKNIHQYFSCTVQENGGEDLDIASRHGYMKYVREEDKDYPFIYIAPQCPDKKYWGCYTESLLAFLDYICETLPVDKDRIYLTGLSMGGTGTWMLAMAEPERFAAIAPVCGTGIMWNTACLVDMPIYIYHGDCDSTVPIQESISMVQSINRRGGKAILEILYSMEHNAWDIAYDGDKLYKWLLSHKKGK